jgi:trehalose-6-phosphate synthase
MLYCLSMLLQTQVSICPMGINPDDFELGPEVRAHMKLLSNAYCSNGRKIIISIDRLDLCKVSFYPTSANIITNTL